jgi:hypothetical protein
MIRLYTLLILVTTAAVAQVSTPQNGFVRDLTGCLRPVLGLPGSFVLGDAIEQGVVSAGFGKTAGYAKTHSEILVIRGGAVAERLAAPAGSSVFYIGSEGEVEQIYFPSARELWLVRRSGFQKTADADPPQLPFELRDGEILFADATRAKLPENAAAVEWLTDKSVVVRGARALYAVRIGGSEPVMQLPQAAQ